MCQVRQERPVLGLIRRDKFVVSFTYCRRNSAQQYSAKIISSYLWAWHAGSDCCTRAHKRTHASANLIYCTGRSNALNIAERLGLDPAIVAAARKRLGTGAGAADAASVALEAARAQADAADAAAFTAAADLDAARVRALLLLLLLGQAVLCPCVVHSVLLLSSLHCIKYTTAFGIDQDTIMYLPNNFQNCCP